MRFRCYDTKDKKWVMSFYIMPNGDMFTFKKKLFGNKLTLMSDDRYILHRDTGLRDRQGYPIFEGDVCKMLPLDGDLETCSEDSFVFGGVVAYCSQHAAYYIFNDEKEECYPLYATNDDYNARVKVIGNVFDGYKQ